MKLNKCFKHATNMVRHSRLRSWLTIIGIIIGIASVVSIISMTDSLEASVNDQFSDVGTDLLTITPGFSKGGSFGPPGRDISSTSSSNSVELTSKDVQVLKGITNIDLIMPQISGRAKVYYLGNSGTLTITGVDQKVWKDITTDSLDTGRYLDSADKNVVVIGYSLAHTYFEDEIGINQVLTIDGKSFRVVGILEDGTRNDIYMPLDLAVEVAEDATKNVYDSIIVKVENEDLLNETMTTIESKLLNSRHVTTKTKDFTVSSNQQSIQMRASMLSSITIFLTVIAGISLLVGAIGIANTMFTSVLEKTKEIGIMKAIGAKNKDILLIFLFNSAIIGLIGGILGLLVGIFISNMIAVSMGVTTVVRLKVVFMALLVSVFAGIIAGFIPANQAARLKPVDALRYE